MTTDDLKRLRGDAEKIVASLAERATEFWEIVNWLDLHCAEARLVSRDDDSSYLEVLIEQAMPDYCTQFSNAVQAGLAEAGWPDVSVRTEW